MTTRYIWRIVDFRPAPEGWRTVVLEGSERRIQPMPGWLIEEEILVDQSTLERDPDDDPTNRPHRVIAAVLDGGELVAAGAGLHDGLFWCVLAPGEPEPTADEEAEFRGNK